MPKPVAHVIHTWLYVRNNKQFIGVSSPDLVVFPDDTVRWSSRDGDGEFSIEFDKRVVPSDPTPFDKEKTDSGLNPLTVLKKTPGSKFGYTVYLKEDRKIKLDPTLIVENP